MMNIILILTAIIVALYAIYKWITKNNKYFDKLDVKHLKPYFLLGNSGTLFLGGYRADEYFKMIHNTFPTEKIYGLFDFRNPIFLIRDPDILKQIAIKDFDYFENHKPFFDLEASGDRYLSNGLFLLKGQKWRQMRSTLSPVFTGSKMRQMFELLAECASDMTKYFQSKFEQNKTDPNYRIDLDMKDMFSRYTNDAIATCAFGIQINSFKNENNEFFVTGKKFLNFTSISVMTKMFVMRVCPRLLKIFNMSLISEKAGNFFKSMVIDTMEVREKNGIIRPDMINILMHFKKGNLAINQQEEKENVDGFSTITEELSVNNDEKLKKYQWTNDELSAQCFGFFLAGFETSSTFLTFVSYELAINADVQQKLYDEISFTHENLNGNNITYETIQKMQYMDMVISETLRKWPPTMLTDRLCVKDYLYDDGKRKLKIEKGIQILISIYGFHHDPEYFPNPDKFDPERFNDANKRLIKPGTYIPFGIGPRNCIGSRFVLMEVKAIIYNLLLNFTIVPNESTQIPLKLKKNAGVTMAENGIHLTLKKRSK